MTGFDVEHKKLLFLLVLSLTQYKVFKKMSFITERRRTRLGLSCFKYLGRNFWSSVSETLKTFKKDCFKVNYKNFLLKNYKE